MRTVPAVLDLRVVRPRSRPAMDQVDGLVYCRACGTRLGVVCPALEGVVPAPAPHTTRADCRAAVGA